MKRSDTWMPLYIGDYLGDTMHLTRDQHGGYLLLIMAYWRNGKPLPDNDNLLSAIAKSSISEWHQGLRAALAPFFSIANGVWHHKRIDIELENVSDRIEKRAAAGRTGAAIRWKNKQKLDHGKRNSKRVLPSGFDAEIPPKTGDKPVDIADKKPEWQTDIPSPSYIYTSDTNVSEDAVEPRQLPLNDPIKEVFDRGVRLLGGRRSLLGKMIKQYGDVAVLEAIVVCETERPVDPASFFVACLKNSTPRENGHAERRSPVDKLWSGAKLAFEEFDRRQGNSGSGGAGPRPLLDRK